jgi:hypothetical protein
MSNVLPIALMALGGVLLGGAASLKRQGAPNGAVLLLGALAVLAVAAATLRLIYGGG